MILGLALRDTSVVVAVADLRRGAAAADGAARSPMLK